MKTERELFLLKLLQINKRAIKELKKTCNHIQHLVSLDKDKPKEKTK